MTEQIRRELRAMEDLPYREFQIKLMPTVPPDTVIGIRTPQLRAYAKQLYRTGAYESFLRDLPHRYYEENNCHGFLIELFQDADVCIEELNHFLPYVDNWATCDMMRPKCFRKQKPVLLEAVKRWLASSHPYTVRYGIQMLMVHFLQEDFRPEYAKWATEINSNEYYVNMMIAWYLATALAFQYDAVISYLERHCLSKWVHNKTIQKAIESYRITPEQKRYLRLLRRK